MNMDSTQSMSFPRVLRGSFEEDRLVRINSNPYDTPNPRSALSSAMAPRKLLGYIKGKMSGAVSSIKQFFGDNQTDTFESIPLTQSLTMPVFSQDKLNSLANSIQETVSKPQFQGRYTANIDRSREMKKTSVLGVVDFYKDISTEKVRESMERNKSTVIPQSIDCQRRPVPLYTQKNTMLEAARKRSGSRKSKVNCNGKRELRSILHNKDKTPKGPKKVSFVPELQRSSSSIIKYTSSDDEEDSIYITDNTQKKIFIDDKVVLKNEPIIQLSLIKSKKLKPNPFHKKYLIEKNSIAKTSGEKPYKKQYNAGKFHDENNFNNINDSKVETDSDSASLLHDSFDSQHMPIFRSMGNKKPQRNRLDSLSDYEEKEEILSSLKADSPIMEEESYFEQEEEEVKEEIPEVKEIKLDFFKKPEPKIVEKPMEEIQLMPKKSPIAEEIKEEKPSVNLLNFIANAEKEKTMEETPKPTPSVFAAFSSGLFANTKKEEKVVEKEQPQPKPLLSNISSSIFGNENTQEKPITTSPMKSLFDNASSISILPKETKPQEIQLPAPVQKEERKEEAPLIAPVLQTTSSSFIETEAAKHPAFAGLQSQTLNQSSNPFLNFSKPADTSNPFLNPKPIAETAAINVAAPENKPMSIFDLVQSTNANTSSSLKTTIEQPSNNNFSWMSGSNQTQSLFGGMNNPVETKPMFEQPPQNDFTTMLTSQKSTMGGDLFGNSQNMMGSSNTLFGASNNQNSIGITNAFLGGNNSMGGGMGSMMRSSSFAAGGDTLFGGNNAMPASNPFLNPSNSMYMSNAGGDLYGGQGSFSVGSGGKKKNTKDRAFM